MTTRAEIPDADTDREAIQRVVADYCEGYYRRDKVQTARAYHPECLKRGFEVNDLGVTYLVSQTRASMVDVAGLTDRATEPEYDIVVDDVTGDIASARLYSNQWVDYLHVARARGRWGLLHAAYDERAAVERTDRDAAADAVSAVATDYVEGWYLARPDQHLRAYHDESVKRAFTDDGGMAYYSGAHMAELCARREPNPDASWTITIDDICGGVASVRIDSTDFVDHLQIAHARGRWAILHASFHVKPGT